MGRTGSRTIDALYTDRRLGPSVIGIVCSRADEASEHVCEHVLSLGDFQQCEDAERADADGGGTYHRTASFELRSFDELHLELDGVAAAFDDPEYVVFASRHSGETGPLLSAHPTGNFGEAEFGGEPGVLAAAPPNAIATVLDRLAEHAPAGYDVSVECTHHGPSEVGAPGLFVEVGSGPEQWDDAEAARAVARSILDLAGVPADAPRERTAGDDGAHRHLVGFGGGHYAPRFTRIARETDWAVGHVAADWSLEDLGDPEAGRATIAAAFERSRAERAVLDGDHPALAAVIEDLGYDVVGETWVRETTGVPLGLVQAAEERLGAVEDGLRFGEPARDGPVSDPAACPVVPLPTDLLARAQGIDREATVAVLDDVAVAYETEEGGTRVGGRAIVPDGSEADEPDSADGTAGRSVPDALLDGLVEVLAQEYDEVRREDGRVIAEAVGFDPTLAREAGVEEGPAFGRLASGSPVEVDGRTVRPVEVESRRLDEFEL